MTATKSSSVIVHRALDVRIWSEPSPLTAAALRDGGRMTVSTS